MELVDQYRYMVSGYYGVSLLDEYPLKEYVLEDIKKYVVNFIETNPINDFDYKEEALKIKEKVSDKVKLQDALLVLNKLDGYMDLILLIKEKLKNY